MVRLLWSFGADFFTKDSREKLIITFTFIIALCILFVLGKEGLQLIGVIVGGYFSFLKGEKSKSLIEQKEILKEEEKPNEE